MINARGHRNYRTCSDAARKPRKIVLHFDELPEQLLQCHRYHLCLNDIRKPIHRVTSRSDHVYLLNAGVDELHSIRSTICFTVIYLLAYMHQQLFHSISLLYISFFLDIRSPSYMAHCTISDTFIKGKGYHLLLSSNIKSFTSLIRGFLRSLKAEFLNLFALPGRYF